jgi:hypothetical protein
MFLLADIITYMRRIIKTPSNTSITDNLLIDYINRFWISDVDARIQLFDMKTSYTFITQPGVDQYNMPLYTVQTEGGQTVGMYPVYQGFFGPVYVNGVEVQFYTQKEYFYQAFPKIIQPLVAVGTGDGSAGPYTLPIPIQPNNVAPQNPPFNTLVRGHIDLNGIMQFGNTFNRYQDPPLITNAEIAAAAIPTNPQFIQSIPVTSVFPAVTISSLDAQGNNVIVTDSGEFLADNINYGLMIQPGPAPLGNLPLPGPPGANYTTTLNTINYFTGQAIVEFPVDIPAGNNINVNCYYFQSGLPRAILYYNNCLTLRVPPSSQFTVELQGYLSPAAFLNTSQAIQFGYMCEYIARGAARKILSDTGDVEQFQFYEPLFREQEMLVWKRSQRQFTATRTQTIYSQGVGSFNNSYGGTLGGYTL